MRRALFSLTLAPLALGACTLEGMPADPKQPRIEQIGTCFLYVTEEGNGKYSVTSGVGDGSRAPLGTVKRGLSAARTDALWAKERAIMDINPECLAIYATDRAQARPAPAPAPVETAKK